MLNSNTKDMQSKANVGTLTVWAILLVSLAATLAYWYVLAGLETATGLSRMWMTLLWVSVAVGLVAEIIKKVTLSTFRNKRIWLAATLVSILTVLGTYSILNQTRQNDLTKQSDSYQDSRANKKAADFLASQYAYAAGYDLQALEQQLDQVIVDRDNRKIKYNTYLKRKQALEKKIEAKRNYDSATGTSQAATANMANGGSVSSSSNPLLAAMAGVFNLSENFLTMIFYLFVTILLEVAAFWIGGEVEKIKQHMKLTEAELLDMKNQELFGFSVRDVQRDLFDRVKRSQQDAINAEYEVQQIRKTRKDDDSGKQLPAGEVAANVNQKRQEADESQMQAKQETVKAESSTQKNDVPENVSVASREESAPAEAKPEQQKSVGFDLPKNAESTAEKNRKKRAEKVDENQLKNAVSDSSQTTTLEPHQNHFKMVQDGHPVQSGSSPYVSTVVTTSKNGANHASGVGVKKSGGLGVENKVVSEPQKNVVSDGEKRKARSDTDLIFPEWKEAVINNQCRLGVDASATWVVKHLGAHTSKQVKKVRGDYAKAIVELLYMRGLADGVIVENPKFGGSKGGVSKYLKA